MPIPSHIPASNPATPAVGQTQLEIEALPALGINPSTALMHPGFYYYFAAECTEKRRMRFLRLLDEEVRTFRATALFAIATDFAAEKASSQGPIQAPGLSNEKKVDHLASILEVRSVASISKTKKLIYSTKLYTKAYEVFKKYCSSPSTPQNQLQGRSTLWIAYRIAQTYYESGKYEMSIR